jgi:dihydrofolate synthase/folylpolyglutamate synthase
MTSDFQNLLKDLYGLQRLGIKTGLEHTHQLLDACGNPHHQLKFIHLAGTNGKGSTAAFILSILRATGLKVGLYSSPHLVRFNERIRVNGVPITDEKIVEYMKLFSADIRRIESTFFETTSAMAFWYFKQEKVDIAVIETGLGGRLDSTNVIEPKIAVITPISMDHRDLLGNEIRSIAREKAGIIKEKTPVISSHQENAVKNVLVQKAAEVDAYLMFVDSPTDCTISMAGTFFRQDNLDYQLTLIGEHQAQNASLAIAAVREFGSPVNDDHIRIGLLNATWPGRFQILSNDPHVIYDVAHNEQGIKSILKTVNNIFEKKPIGLFAHKEDKELELIANVIHGKFGKLLVMDDEQGLLMRSETLSMNLSKHGIAAELMKRFDDFTSYLLNGHPGIIFGSHYMAKPVFEHFQFPFDTGVI